MASFLGAQALALARVMLFLALGAPFFLLAPFFEVAASGATCARFPAKLPDLQYPEGAHLRRVSHHGDVKVGGVNMFVSSLLRWEVVGLLEREQDPDWLEVYYGPLLIGWMDLKRLTLLPIGTGKRR